VAHDPLREAHHQLLIRLHSEGGDRAGALRAYHQCMSLLRRELGVEPGPPTRELFERVRKSEAPAAAPAPKEAPPTTAAAAAAHRGTRSRAETAGRCVECGGIGRNIRMAVILGETGHREVAPGGRSMRMGRARTPRGGAHALLRRTGTGGPTRPSRTGCAASPCVRLARM